MSLDSQIIMADVDGTPMNVVDVATTGRVVGLDWGVGLGIRIGILIGIRIGIELELELGLGSERIVTEGDQGRFR